MKMREYADSFKGRLVNKMKVLNTYEWFDDIKIERTFYLKYPFYKGANAPEYSSSRLVQKFTSSKAKSSTVSVCIYSHTFYSPHAMYIF